MLTDHIPAGNTKTLSIFAKAGTAGTRLALLPANDSSTVIFNLETGAVVSGSGSIQNYGNGWYRCSTVTSVNITSSRNFIIHAICSSYSDFIYIAGCQFEAGAFPTSYIPTAGSQVTRTADTASITGTNFSSWYNTTQGTFLVKIPNYLDIQSYGTINPYYGGISLTPGNQPTWGSATNIVGMIQSGSGGWGVQGNLHPGTQFYSGTSSPNFAISCNTTSFDLTRGGSQPSSYIVDNFWRSDVNTLRISDNGRSIYSHISYYPTRLTNTQLQALTR